MRLLAPALFPSSIRKFVYAAHVFVSCWTYYLLLLYKKEMLDAK